MLEWSANHDGRTLNHGQAAMVTEVATSGRRVHLALAPAGTGKTTVMGVLARAWQGTGGHVVGLAPQASRRRRSCTPRCTRCRPTPWTNWSTRLTANPRSRAPAVDHRDRPELAGHRRRGRTGGDPEAGHRGRLRHRPGRAGAAGRGRPATRRRRRRRGAPRHRRRPRVLDPGRGAAVHRPHRRPRHPRRPGRGRRRGRFLHRPEPAARGEHRHRHRRRLPGVGRRHRGRGGLGDDGPHPGPGRAAQRPRPRRPPRRRGRRRDPGGGGADPDQRGNRVRRRHRGHQDERPQPVAGRHRLRAEQPPVDRPARSGRTGRWTCG